MIKSYQIKLRENEDSIGMNLQWYTTSLYKLVSVTASLSIRILSKDP